MKLPIKNMIMYYAMSSVYDTGMYDSGILSRFLGRKGSQRFLVHRVKVMTVNCNYTFGFIGLGDNRAVASLTVPGGQEFHLPQCSTNRNQLFIFFLKLCSFSSSFSPSGLATCPPGKALATPLGDNSQIVFVNAGMIKFNLLPI